MEGFLQRIDLIGVIMNKNFYKVIMLMCFCGAIKAMAPADNVLVSVADEVTLTETSYEEAKHAAHSARPVVVA